MPIKCIHSKVPWDSYFRTKINGSALSRNGKINDKIVLWWIHSVPNWNQFGNWSNVDLPSSINIKIHLRQNCSLRPQRYNAYNSILAVPETLFLTIGKDIFEKSLLAEKQNGRLN